MNWPPKIAPELPRTGSVLTGNHFGRCAARSISRHYSPAPGARSAHVPGLERFWDRLRARSLRLHADRGVKTMTEQIGELLPPTRLMLTPGPSCVDPRVYRAMATPIVGHLDPWFMEMMGDVQVLLRRIFRTENRVTFP